MAQGEIANGGRMRSDVVVIGAGLAGLSAARDLAAAGTDVVVLEGRARAGGRVEQTVLPDGRPVQLGGEVVGEFHTSYLDLVEELGLTVVPAFPGLPGEDTAVFHGSTFVGEEFGWLSGEDRRQYERVEEAFTALSREVDPEDPWSHPDARRLDETSVGDWLRAQGAGPAVVRAREMAMAALGAESVERTSLLADLRKEAAAGSPGFYNYDAWESLRVEEGSATVALRMATELGHRVRYSTVVSRIDVAAAGCTVFAESGETFRCDAVVCALPAGPLRDVEVNGVSPERVESLSRQRHALASKVVFAYGSSFWEKSGQNGSAYCEPGYLGGTWAQREGLLSALVPAERLSPLLATSPEHLEGELLEEAATMYGEPARDPHALFIRHWCLDPMTQGYITAWRPGDVMAVGPLHGTHDPPFYVAGSDQWVCGYMEGAVRTGRRAARAAIAGSATAP
jgi:monoamine oxidase